MRAFDENLHQGQSKRESSNYCTIHGEDAEFLVESMTFPHFDSFYFSCEAIIFVFLGLSTFSKKHDWDISFAVVTVTACVISRFIGKLRNIFLNH